MRAADIIGTITLNGTPPPEVPYTPLMNDPTCGAMYNDHAHHAFLCRRAEP